MLRTVDLGIDREIRMNLRLAGLDGNDHDGLRDWSRLHRLRGLERLDRLRDRTHERVARRLDRIEQHNSERWERLHRWQRDRFNRLERHQADRWERLDHRNFERMHRWHLLRNEI